MRTTERDDREKLVFGWLTALLIVGLLVGLIWHSVSAITAENIRMAHDRAAGCQHAAPEQVAICLKLNR